MKIIVPKAQNPGDKTPIEREVKIPDLSFNIHKFNNRPKPNSNNIVFICCFAEFGCVTLAPTYCIPRIIASNPGKYFILVGWYGREYLYRHLMDEYWEIKEEFQYLREYCRAFHHESKNLANLEEKLKNLGHVISSSNLGHYALGARCTACGGLWGTQEPLEKCKGCGSEVLEPSLFNNVNFWKNKITKIPSPSADKLALADQYVKPNTVGVFARGIKRYGRNLQPEFYVKLINLLEELGYNVLWLGEKQSVQPCPVPHILDMSKMPEYRDLELVLAVISKLKFTIQFWTASTRLASMVGTPYILFESPDQLWGNGQEGFRRELLTFSPYKLAICHFLNVVENTDKGIGLVRRCISELESGNCEDILDMLEDVDLVKKQRADWLGKFK